MKTIYLRKKAIKKHLLLVAMICFLSLAESTSTLMYGYDNIGDPVSSIIGISNHQKKQYKKDATRLALRQLVDGTNFEMLDAKVPKNIVESIYSSLIAIHISELPEAKVVSNISKLVQSTNWRKANLVASFLN